MLKLGTDGGATVPFVGSGTSFVPPAVAGIAGMVMSTFPGEFEGDPRRLIDRLVDTLQACAPSPAGVRSCHGSMLHPGRIDLFDAVDATVPLPPTPAWRPASHDLRGSEEIDTNTKDIRFIDRDADPTNGSADFLLEVSGAPFVRTTAVPFVDPVFIQRLFSYDGAAVYREVSGTSLGFGLFFPPFVTTVDATNFSEAVAADFNGDGCTDVIMSGDGEAAVLSAPCVLTEPATCLGTAEWVLFQTQVGGMCTGIFLDVTAFAVDGVELLFNVPKAISMDIDAFDADLDGDLDVYLTNRYVPEFAAIGLLDVSMDVVFLNAPCVSGTPAVVDPGFPNAGCFQEMANVFAPGVAVGASPTSRRNTALCDLDGDGRADVAQAGEPGASRVLLFDPVANQFVTAPALPIAGTEDLTDVACADLVGGPLPDLVFAQLDGPNLLLENLGGGVFADVSFLLPPVSDPTQAVAVCELDPTNGRPEILFANGDVAAFRAYGNRVLRFDGASFVDADVALGFYFTPPGVAPGDPVVIGGVSTEIDCGDRDGDGVIDIVAFGHRGSARPTLFIRR